MNSSCSIWMKMESPTNQSSERGGYFDIGPSDGGENTRRDMVLYLADMGIEVESSYSFG